MPDTKRENGRGNNGRKTIDHEGKNAEVCIYDRQQEFLSQWCKIPVGPCLSFF